MPVEIERKFLVQPNAWPRGHGRPIEQGYLRRDAACVVRVRLDGQQAFLTIKGATTGASRLEFEHPIPPEEAHALIALCDGVIRKTRHTVPAGDGLVWEIDEFHGDNAGLVVAEIELPSEDHVFARPPWLGAEVTDDARYLNAALVDRPFNRWFPPVSE